MFSSKMNPVIPILFFIAGAISFIARQPKVGGTLLCIGAVFFVLERLNR